MPDISPNVLTAGISVNSVTVRLESDYLLISNKEKCKELLQQYKGNCLTQELAIDFLIALHIVLEVGLNTFFRHVTVKGIKKGVKFLDVSKNLDRISFIDKVVLFIYNSKFHFGEDVLEKATEYHAIIGKLRQFSEARNKLLHGHSISTITDSDGTRHSEAYSITQEEKIIEQIKRFRFIMEGLRFYFDCLESAWTPSGKEALKSSYLDSSFLALDRE